jgi:S-adenosylmethionine-diacylglycerol 3-amino-3-carboxypropyl transferase
MDVRMPCQFMEGSNSSTVRYGAVWEDADVLCEALAPIAPGKKLLSIASAGDNVLALLTLDPAEVIAIDCNAAQLSSLELRMAAFMCLCDDDIPRFLGAESSPNRLQTYAKLRTSLQASTREFWDCRPRQIELGIIRCGQLERYLDLFRKCILPLVHSKRTTNALLKEKSRSEREFFYQEVWNTWRWRLLFSAFFNQTTMTLFGRQASNFEHVSGSIVTHLLQRVKHALVDLDTHNNPFLTYVVTGSYKPGALPKYLEPENIPRIRNRIARIRIVHGRVENSIGNEEFDGFNLSNIFEYMSPEQHERSYLYLLRHAKRKARFAYWNLFVQRSIPKQAELLVSNLFKTAEELHQRDRACSYSSFHLDEVS